MACLDLKKLCIHTMTVKKWSLPQALLAFEKAGVPGITVWRQALEGHNLHDCRRWIEDSGRSVVSLCRGGFFPAVDRAGRQAAIDDNRRAIEQAHAIGAPMLVLVCGALPGQTLEQSRDQIREGIAAVLPDAVNAGVKLAIEPLHPMYAAERSAVNTLEQANDLVEALGSEKVGVAVDVYHLWWDPRLEEQIRRTADLKALLAFHVCDWLSPTGDMLNDRGLMGEGVIDIPRIRGWVEAAGFSGFNEVEIFSNRWWSREPEEFLAEIVRAYREHV